MLPQDYFVGAVSVLLGTFALTGAMLNLDWYYRLKKAQRIEARLGRRGARLYYALVGFGLIALGIAIAFGYTPSTTSQRKIKTAPPDEPRPPLLALHCGAR